jgi:16S rRNA processing protein RimM
MAGETHQSQLCPPEMEFKEKRHMTAIFANHSPVPEGMVSVGRITKPQALRGAVRVHPEVDDFAIFQPEVQLGVRSGKNPLRWMKIVKVEYRSSLVIVKLEGVEDVDQAEQLRGAELFMYEEDLPGLPEDSFYYYEMTGCKVVLPDGSQVGQVVDIIPGAGGDLIVVHTSEGEKLVPAVGAIVRRIDTGSGVIEIDPPEGLL